MTPPVVVLINANTCVSPYPVFPLGLAHLSSTLESKGRAVRMLDLSDGLTSVEADVARIKPQFIGLSLRNIDDLQIGNIHVFAPVLENLTKRLRAISPATIILGGSGYSLFPGRLLEQTGADFGIAGEGEYALPQLLDCLESGADYRTIPGLAYRDGTVVKVNAKSELSPGEIRTPNYPSAIAQYYINASSMLNVQTQRGCAFTCCYCTYPVIEGVRFRRRDPKAVCDDFCAAQHAAAGYVFVVDSVFNTSQEHVVGVCEELLRRSVALKWGCFLRPQGVSQSMMQLMARAGCTHIEFGTDSLCDSVLDAYGKGFTFDDVLLASECARQAKIHFAHFLIAGGPTETEATLRQSFANAQRIKRTIFFPFIGMRIYHDTALHAFAIREGVIDANTDLLQPHFFVSPLVGQERISQLLAEFGAQMQNWIVGEISPDHVRIMQQLRQKGVVGPLWEFLVR